MGLHHVPSYFIQPQHAITVNVIGCGGTGSQLLTQLARIDYALRAGGTGMGSHPGLHVRAFDADTISEANIGRQNFSASEIGQNKAITLISRINRFYGQNWEAYPFMYDNTVIEKGLHLANIIITCVDSARARFEIATINKQRKANEFLNIFERQFYWLDTGNSRNSGQVVLGTLSKIPQPDVEGCVEELPTILDMFPDMAAHDTVEEQGHSCSVAEAINSQDLCVNSQMAEWAKKLIWSLFKKMRLDAHGVFVNLETMSVNPIPVPDAQEIQNPQRHSERLGGKQKKQARRAGNTRSKSVRVRPRPATKKAGRAKKPKKKAKTARR